MEASLGNMVGPWLKIKFYKGWGYWFSGYSCFVCARSWVQPSVLQTEKKLLVYRVELIFKEANLKKDETFSNSLERVRLQPTG